MCCNWSKNNWTSNIFSSNMVVEISRYITLKPRPNGLTLFGKHFEFCLSCMLVRVATTTSIAWQAHFACHFWKTVLLVTSKNVCQARLCIVAKPTNIVLAKLQMFAKQCLIVLYRYWLHIFILPLVDDLFSFDLNIWYSFPKINLKLRPNQIISLLSGHLFKS